MAFEDYCSPLLDDFYITSGYGFRTHPKTRRRSFHEGIDLNDSRRNGSYEVRAIKDGIVRTIQRTERTKKVKQADGTYKEKAVGAGCYVTITHENDGEVPNLNSQKSTFYTCYFHLKLDSIPENLQKNSRISKGQVIGIIGSTGGSTGPHLHFEIRTADRKHIDPFPFLEKYSEYKGPEKIGTITRVVYKGKNPADGPVSPEEEHAEKLRKLGFPVGSSSTPSIPQNSNVGNEKKKTTGINKPKNLEEIKDAISDEDLKASLLGFYFPSLVKRRNIYTEPSRLIYLNTDRKSAYAHNLLFARSPDGVDFSLLNSLDISNMVPYVEMSAIRKTFDTDSNSEIFEFAQYPFDDYTNKIKLDSIFADKTGRGGNVGIESVSWKTIATNPSNKSQVQVSIKIRIQDIQEIETKRNGVSLLDFLYPAGTRNEEFDHDNFNVKLKVGWLYKREKNESIPDIDKKINEEFLSETILVSLYKHSFEFDPTGTVLLDLQYIGMLETRLKSLKDFDILESLSPEAKKYQKRVQSLEFAISQLENANVQTFQILASKPKYGVFVNRHGINTNNYSIVFQTENGFEQSESFEITPQGDGANEAVEEAKRILSIMQRKLKESYFPGLKNLLSFIPIYYFSITNEQKSILKDLSTINTDFVSEKNFENLRKKIAKTAINKQQIKKIPVNKQSIERMFSTDDPTFYQSVEVYAKKAANAYLDFVPEFLSTKARFTEGLEESVISETETIVSAEGLLKQLLPLRKDPNEAEQVAYTYLGDILGFYMTLFFENKDLQEMDFFTAVGSFSYRDVGELSIDKKNKNGESKFVTSDTLYFSDGTPYKKLGLEKKYANILDIPVSIESVVNWYNTHIIDSSKEKMSLLSFIKNIFVNIVPANLANQILDYGNKRTIQVSNNYLSLTKDKQLYNDIVDELKLYRDSNPELIKEQKAPQLEINLEDDDTSFKYLKRLLPTSGQKSNMLNFLFILSTGEKDNLISDYKQDKEKGIYHFHIGEDTGMVREIKFSKEDNPALDSANIIKANKSQQQKIIRQIYQADLELVGNTIFSPGQLIHISPTYPGGRLKNKTLYQIGLGGYYRIISIENFIENGKFETRLKTKWEMHGEDIVDEVSFDGFMRVGQAYSQTAESPGIAPSADAAKLAESGNGVVVETTPGVKQVLIGAKR